MDDHVEGHGPLVGILAGLRAVGDRGRGGVRARQTDAPGLSPGFVRRVLAAVDDGVDVALPDALGHRQPLAAAYRTSLAPLVAGLVAEGRLRPAFLFEAVRVRVLRDAELDAADPGLGSLRNLNEPADYDVARAEPAPAVRVGDSPRRPASRGVAGGRRGGARRDARRRVRRRRVWRSTSHVVAALERRPHGARPRGAARERATWSPLMTTDADG